MFYSDITLFNRSRADLLTLHNTIVLLAFIMQNFLLLQYEAVAYQCITVIVITVNFQSFMQRFHANLEQKVF